MSHQTYSKSNIIVSGTRGKRMLITKRTKARGVHWSFMKNICPLSLVGLDVIIIMTRVTVEGQKGGGEHTHVHLSRERALARLFALNRILMHSSSSFAARRVDYALCLTCVNKAGAGSATLLNASGRIL